VAENFSLHHRVYTGSGPHSHFYPAGTRGFFLGVKLPGPEADHSLHRVPISRMRGAIIPLPITPSWRGVRLKHRNDFIFTFMFIISLFEGSLK
jgi:hypothetical protein